MKVLIVGYGSIGQRHAKILRSLSCDIAIVSTRTVHLDDCYYDLADALFHHKPEYVVIATRTGEHFKTINTLVDQGYKGRVLVEKPLFDIVLEMPSNEFYFSAVAYNLRFHPIILKLKNLLKENQNDKLITVTMYVGSYLPNWRSSTDYRISYSAIKNQGGGVLRDLSHELDIAFWLFGPWTHLSALGGHFSNLEIDSDDAFTVIMKTVKCPVVTIHMNYLDRTPKREIIINTEKTTIKVDLIANKLDINGASETVEFDLNETYIAEHNAMISGSKEHLCSIEDAIDTVLTIQAAENAAINHSWITKN